jgi:sugar phosphate isomerase/epimerase
MISIGNQTAFSASSFNEPFDYAVAHGFDAFEWFPDKKPDGSGWDDQDLSSVLRAQIRKVAETRKMRLSVHARWTINPLLPEAAPLLVREMELAHDIGATVVVVHLYPEQGIAAYAKALVQFVPIANTKGLKIAVENTVHTSPSEFNQLFTDMAPSLRDAVGMCLDIGHANLCSATRNDYLGFLDQLDASIPIIHVHLHENRGDADSHLTLFTGPSGQNDSGLRGLVHRLNQRGFSGAAILEQWPQPHSLLDEARERLVKIWNEERAGVAPNLENSRPGRETQMSKTEIRKNSEARSSKPRLTPASSAAPG